MRLQGYRGAPPADVKPIGECTLSIVGSDERFHLTAWQRFGIRAVVEASPPEPRLILQGSRGDLAKVGAARPGQRVTILGERRPGANDLFLLAVDLCPPD